jgi:hypothetical protein
MAHSAPFISERETHFPEPYGKNEASTSPVSWAAVIAGAVVTAALSLILLAFGAGMGLSSVSPWGGTGASATAVSRGAILWLIVMEIVASAIGGYLAGRLRTKWVNVHTDEVYFRDTVHGFLVWAVSVVITGAFLASTAAFMVGSSSRAAGAQADGRTVDPNAYFVDALFRTNPPTPIDASARAESETILTNALRMRELPGWDRTYLSEMVAAKTGLTGNDAEQRVTEVMDQARSAADTARKAAAHSLYWLFLALLIGAFSASLAATVGGRQRDRMRAL